jgi:hypothetical protein
MNSPDHKFLGTPYATRLNFSGTTTVKE